MENIMSSWKISISSKHKYNKHVQNLQMLHSPFSIHLCFPLGTMKSCFVSEWLTKVDPRTVRFGKILNFWATIVIQIFHILSKKIGQQSTLFESLCKHFCIHYFYVVKDSKQLIKIQPSTTPRNSMQMNCVPSRLFIRFESLWWTKWKSL